MAEDLLKIKTVDQMNDQERIVYFTEKIADLRIKIMNVMMMYEALLQTHNALMDEYQRIVKEHGLESKILKVMPLEYR